MSGVLLFIGKGVIFPHGKAQKSTPGRGNGMYSIMQHLLCARLPLRLRIPVLRLVWEANNQPENNKIMWKVLWYRCYRSTKERHPTQIGEFREVLLVEVSFELSAVDEKVLARWRDGEEGKPGIRRGVPPEEIFSGSSLWVRYSSSGLPQIVNNFLWFNYRMNIEGAWGDLSKEALNSKLRSWDFVL